MTQRTMWVIRREIECTIDCWLQSVAGVVERIKVLAERAAYSIKWHLSGR